MMMSSRSGGISGLRSVGSTAVSRTCLYATETGESAVNGATPVTISYNTTPSA